MTHEREQCTYRSWGEWIRAFIVGWNRWQSSPFRVPVGLREALRGMVARDNPIVPMLRRSEIQPPVLLKHAGVKSWSAFERDMLFWDVTKDSGAYQIAGQSKHPEGMWKDDLERTIPSGATDDDVIDRMIAILRGAAQK